MSRRSGRSPQAVAQLVHGLKGLVKNEVENHGTTVERWRVTQGKPLVIEQLEGDVTLEEGDPDFTVGDSLRQHIATYGLSTDDQVLVSRSGGEWHAFDAASNTTPKATRLSSGSYTITGATPTRTLNVGTATATDVANVLAALIEDMGGV